MSSDKPSLYVVEKKEVVILVALFVLVTVLSFTLGVRYGETVGRNNAHEQAQAEKDQGEGSGDTGGTLGKAPPAAEPAKTEGAAEPGKEAKDAGKEGAKPEATAKPEGEQAAGEAKPAGDSHSPESAAKESAPAAAAPTTPVDKNSDEYLLNALKDAGVEPPGGKAPKNETLPEETKKTAVPSGSWVLQVGSYPTRSEADARVRQLKAKNVAAEVMAPVEENSRTWHRVIAGYFKSKMEAMHEGNLLKSARTVRDYVVRNINSPE